MSIKQIPLSSIMLLLSLVVQTAFGQSNSSSTVWVEEAKFGMSIHWLWLVSLL